MPYCPRCRDEFQDWVEVCPDCNVTLVDELPPVPKPAKRKGHDDPLVPIATAANEAMANMWAGMLEENGIHCLIKDKLSGVTLSVWSMNRPCEIHVIASEARRATRILAPFL